MSKYSENEISETRKYVVDLMETDVLKALEDRSQAGCHSTVYPATESYCETGVVYIEFNDFSAEPQKLILGRKGESLELGLYLGDIKKISDLKLLKNFGDYSKENVKAAIEFYFSNLCKIIESN